MRAAVFEGVRKPLVVRGMPDPTPAPDGALIRVEANEILQVMIVWEGPNGFDCSWSASEDRHAVAGFAIGAALKAERRRLPSTTLSGIQQTFEVAVFFVLCEVCRDTSRGRNGSNRKKEAIQ
jgi:hypothetical protein